MKFSGLAKSLGIIAACIGHSNAADLFRLTGNLKDLQNQLKPFTLTATFEGSDGTREISTSESIFNVFKVLQFEGKFLVEAVNDGEELTNHVPVWITKQLNFETDIPAPTANADEFQPRTATGLVMVPHDFTVQPLNANRFRLEGRGHSQTVELRITRQKEPTMVMIHIPQIYLRSLTSGRLTLVVDPLGYLLAPGAGLADSALKTQLQKIGGTQLCEVNDLDKDLSEDPVNLSERIEALALNPSWLSYTNPERCPPRSVFYIGRSQSKEVRKRLRLKPLRPQGLSTQWAKKVAMAVRGVAAKGGIDGSDIDQRVPCRFSGTAVPVFDRRRLPPGAIADGRGRGGDLNAAGMGRWGANSNGWRGGPAGRGRPRSGPGPRGVAGPGPRMATGGTTGSGAARHAAARPSRSPGFEVGVWDPVGFEVGHWDPVPTNARPFEKGNWDPKLAVSARGARGQGRPILGRGARKP